jgi:hypothetical protein
VAASGGLIQAAVGGGWGLGQARTNRSGLRA